MGLAAAALLLGLCLFSLLGRQKPPTLPISERNNQPIEPTPLYTCIGPLGGVNSVALSPDGALLAVGGGNVVMELRDGTTVSKGEIALLRTSDGSVLHTLRGHTWGITSLAFSPDSALLASGSGFVDATKCLCVGFSTCPPPNLPRGRGRSRDSLPARGEGWGGGDV